MLLRSKFLILACLGLFPMTRPVHAENRTRSLALLPAIDKSSSDLSSEFIIEADQFFKSTGLFEVSSSTQQIAAYTQAEIQNTFQKVKTECFSFVFVEPSRVAIFLFDSAKPDGFLVSHQGYTASSVPSENRKTIRSLFRPLLGEVLTQYQAGQFKKLPVPADPVLNPVPERKIASVEPNATESVENTNSEKQASLGVGLDYVFPLINYQYLLNQHISVGLGATLIDYSLPSHVGIKGFGGTVSVNYYEAGNFEGLWLTAGMGYYTLNVSGVTDQESRGLPSILARAGWRWKWATGPNFGFGVGAQYLLGLSSERIPLSGSSGILPSIILEIAFLL